jgi:hypothetical protein
MEVTSAGVSEVAAYGSDWETVIASASRAIDHALAQQSTSPAESNISQMAHALRLRVGEIALLSSAARQLAAVVASGALQAAEHKLET